MPVARRAVKRNQPEMYDCPHLTENMSLPLDVLVEHTSERDRLGFRKIKRSEALSVDRLKTVCLNVVHVE